MNTSIGHHLPQVYCQGKIIKGTEIVIRIQHLKSISDDVILSKYENPSNLLSCQCWITSIKQTKSAKTTNIFEK